MKFGDVLAWPFRDDYFFMVLDDMPNGILYIAIDDLHTQSGHLPGVINRQNITHRVPDDMRVVIQ